MMKEMYMKLLQGLLVQAGVLFDIYLGLEVRMQKGDISKRELEAHLYNIEKIGDALKELYEDADFNQLMKEMEQELAQNVMEIGKIYTELYHGLREEYDELNSEIITPKQSPVNIQAQLFCEFEKLRFMMPWELKNIKE